jgi:hypothetical protein
MTKPLYVYALTFSLFAACSSSASSSAASASAQQMPKQEMPKGSQVNPDAGLIADFNKRVDDYEKLRDSAAKSVTPLKDKSTPEEIVAHERALGAQVRALRQNAKRGDFFTPATEAALRRLVNPAVKGADGAENKKIIKDDAPAAHDVPFKVNAAYPKDVQLSTVPPDVLLSLPTLPKDKHIEFRFAGKHMLLYDAEANLILDFMLNALP